MISLTSQNQENNFNRTPVIHRKVLAAPPIVVENITSFNQIFEFISELKLNKQLTCN